MHHLSLRLVGLRLLAIAFLLLCWALVIAPVHAQALDPSYDAGPMITLFAAMLPHPYDVWLGWVVGLATLLCTVCSILSNIIPPPTMTAPKWLIQAYRLLTLLALCRGWARNAVVPGMPPAVRQAAADTAKLAEAAPHLTTVAQAPAIMGVISPGLTQLPSA